MAMLLLFDIKFNNWYKSIIEQLKTTNTPQEYYSKLAMLSYLRYLIIKSNSNISSYKTKHMLH